MSEKALKPVDEMSFEEALAELEDIVKTLESGQGDLDRSISDYERGMALKGFCETKLKEAEAKVEKITVTPDGEVKTEAFSAE